MLNTLRQSAQGFFVKLLLFFIVGLFVLWGIGDIFRTGGGNANVATVGGTAISAQEFARGVHRRQEDLRQMLGNAYKPELVKTLGIPSQVLSGLINQLLIEKEDASLGIVISDDVVVDALRTMPEFQNADKQFDKALYLNALKSIGMPEQAFVADKRREIAAELLLATLARAVVVPEPLVQALYKARGEQRVADLLVIPLKSVAQQAQPSDKDLQEYYDAHASAFLAPETRTLSYVEIKAADVQAGIKVPEEDIKHVYDEHSADLRTPERRVVEQMVFEKEADARKASDQIRQGADFDKIARTAPITNKGKLSLGALTRAQVPVAADEVFALPEGGSSAPAQAAFGWHILHVSKIEPESTTTLEEARADITRDLAAKSAQETIYKLVGELEDALAGGATLESAAQKIGQSIHTVGPMTKDGLSPQGKKLPLPTYENFLTVAFSTPQGDHSQATQSNDGSYFLVHADTVTPEHTRPFAEVKDQVTTAWKAEKNKAQLQTLADALAADMQAGKKPQDTLAAHHVNILTVSSGKLKRSSEELPAGSPLAGKALPRPMVLELFHLKAGQSTHAYPFTDGGMLIASVQQIVPAPAAADAPTLEAIRKELRETMSNEELRHYIGYLQDKYRVIINQSVLGALSQDSGE